MSSIGNIVPESRRWDVIAGFMKAQGYSTFVEVGCKEGRTTGFVLKNVPGSKVTAVDPWRPFPQREGLIGGETYKEWNFDEIEATFWKNVGDEKDRVTMLRCTSLEAAAEIENDSTDIVFIDAGHDYDSVREDIDAWWPKVREGGILCGHDYNHKWPGVMAAVAERFCLMDVGVGGDSVWFILKRA